MWILLLAVVISWRILIYLNFRKKYDFARSIPTFKPSYPVIGCGYLFLRKTEVQRFINLRKLFDGDHKMFRLWMGPKMIVGTTDPDVAQAVLTDPVWLDKPFIYDFFKVNHGLFGAKVDLWKVQRKALNPTFNLKILQSFIPIFDEFSRKMLEQLYTVPEAQTINALEYARKCAMEMVMATTIGFDANILKEVDILGNKIEHFFYLASIRILNVFHYSDVIYRWSKEYREEKALRKDLNHYASKIVRHKENQYDEEARRLAQNESDEQFKTPQIFIDELLANKLKKFSNIEIFENVFTMVGAGTDTSSGVIAFCMLTLGFYPEIQQKVYEEVMRVYPDDQPVFSLDSLKQLVYMEMVMKETLRLYPVAPLLIRQSSAESTIEGIRIPKGNLIAIHVFNLQRRKDLWGDDANNFIPERFTAERLKGVHPFAFLAFSAGSRNCIGSRYAMLSMKIMMVHLIKAFRIKTLLREEDLIFRFEGILRIENGHMIQLERR